MNPIGMTTIAQAVSCIDGYDPDALRVDQACAAIRACLRPVAGTERVPVRAALGRVLAQEIVPQIDVILTRHTPHRRCSE